MTEKIIHIIVVLCTDWENTSQGKRIKLENELELETFV